MWVRRYYVGYLINILGILTKAKIITFYNNQLLYNHTYIRFSIFPEIGSRWGRVYLLDGGHCQKEEETAQLGLSTSQQECRLQKVGHNVLPVQWLIEMIVGMWDCVQNFYQAK